MSIYRGTEKVAVSFPIKNSGVEYEGSYLITPGTQDIVIPENSFLTKDLVVEGDVDLDESNIAKGVEIFGKTGTYVGNPFPNGREWELLTDSPILTDMYYANGIWVAFNIGETGLWYSLDNTDTWVQATGTDDMDNTSFKCVYNAAGIWVAGGEDKIFYSINGMDDWTLGLGYKINGTILNINYGDGTWIAAGTAGPYFSYDGKTWTSAWGDNPKIDNVYIKQVDYGNGMWAIGGVDKTGLFFADNNRGGIEFMSSFGRDVFTFTPVCYADGKWVASCAEAGMATSTDGKNWFPAQFLPANLIRNANGIWVAATDVGLWYSLDGEVWEQSNMTYGESFSSLYYGNGVWIAGRYSSGEKLYYSTDGKTWAECKIPSDQTFYFYSVYYANGIWLAGSNKGLCRSISYKGDVV